ncbi:hypothetical protein Mucpa_4145 [Mucilaginibacter paludis DSM 18603]|uniref:Uncharacterized protein n=1 Tax=Mucilaginibacter paludis DSM 18603 TaxID=714943 RepID=H1Y2Q7_9SPHI|nr:hypothetical protein Mucpa_4145 [Mucilaginibacter paludis DSM 18603]
MGLRMIIRSLLFLKGLEISVGYAVIRCKQNALNLIIL